MNNSILKITTNNFIEIPITNTYEDKVAFYKKIPIDGEEIFVDGVQMDNVAFMDIEVFYTKTIPELIEYLDTNCCDKKYLDIENINAICDILIKTGEYKTEDIMVLKNISEHDIIEYDIS